MDTRQALLEHASILIRTRGYSGFSYADLAEQVGIRKASIHHHFPTKEDLGLALVDQYIDLFGQALTEISRRNLSPFDALQAYANIYRSSLEQGWACLCGMLASEVEVVPTRVAMGVRRFMAQSQQWLTELISAGVRDGEFAVGADPIARAATFLSICQGALLVSRAMQSPASFEQAIAGGLQAFKAA
jgi:TetR/AcrR family transcriptional regulator, transcriptional repressor for nem operon